jgi:diguanylate cyclase (GGDEF)-like protein
VQAKFASRRVKTFNRENLKFVLPVFFAIIALINIFGFYPQVVFHPVVSAMIYIVLFACLFFLERKKAEKSTKTAIRLYYILFAFMLTLAGISGGLASPLKWSAYILVFAAVASGWYMHAGIMLAVFLLSSARQLGDSGANDIFSFTAAAGFIALYYFTRGKRAGAGPKAFALDFESSRESREFRVIASELLEKLMNVYRALLGAETVMFFLKEPGQETEYSLMMSSSSNPETVDKSFRLKVKEGLLGAAINKKEFFVFDPGSVKMPYYNAKTEIKEAVVMPVLSGSRIIGAVSADFKEEPREKEYLRARLQNLSGELISIMQLFEINTKVISRERRVTLLYDIYGKLNLLDGKKEMMQVFFEEIKAFDIYSGYLAEYLPEEKEFTVTECFNYQANAEGARISPRDDEILKFVFGAGTHMLVDNAAEKNLRINFKRMNVDKFFISMLKNKSEIFGYIKLDKEKGYGFNEFEIKTLQMILARITVLLENLRLYEKIKKQATLDGLTGLINHMTFQEKLSCAMTKKENSYSCSVYLALMDIDYFKKFNDSFGHQEGDRVLKKLAAALRDISAKYPGTFPARYGGEEFVFVMEDCDLRKASSIAEEIRAFSEDNLRGGDEKEKRKITLSIGLAGTDKAVIPRELIKNADDALYLAKQEGRNRVKVF